MTNFIWGIVSIVDGIDNAIDFAKGVEPVINLISYNLFEPQIILKSKKW